jgi:TRAP-type C4-dicarboxylate transport system permease small subunit
MHRLEKLLTKLVDGVITLFFALILLITITQVFLRYGLNTSLLGGNEAMEGLFIYTTALGAAVAIRFRRHISINYLVQKLPLPALRALDALNHLLIAGFNGVLIYYSYDWIRQVGGHESPVMRVPEWLFQISVPLGCFLVILYCLFTMVLDWLEPEETRLRNGAC